MKELDEMMRENIRFLKKNAQSYYQYYLTLNRKERENWFIKNNQYMLLSKEMWDHIFERVMDNVYVFRLIALFCVDCYQSLIIYCSQAHFIHNISSFSRLCLWLVTNNSSICILYKQLKEYKWSDVEDFSKAISQFVYPDDLPALVQDMKESVLDPSNP